MKLKSRIQSVQEASTHSKNISTDFLTNYCREYGEEVVFIASVIAPDSNLLKKIRGPGILLLAKFRFYLFQSKRVVLNVHFFDIKSVKSLTKTKVTIAAFNEREEIPIELESPTIPQFLQSFRECNFSFFFYNF